MGAASTRVDASHEATRSPWRNWISSAALMPTEAFRASNESHGHEHTSLAHHRLHRVLGPDVAGGLHAGERRLRAVARLAAGRGPLAGPGHRRRRALARAR